MIVDDQKFMEFYDLAMEMSDEYASFAEKVYQEVTWFLDDFEPFLADFREMVELSTATGTGGTVAVQAALLERLSVKLVSMEKRAGVESQAAVPVVPHTFQSLLKRRAAGESC